MKKVLSILLIVVMISSIMTMSIDSAYAQVNKFSDDEIASDSNSESFELTVENLAQYGVIEIKETSPGYYEFRVDKYSHNNILELNYRLWYVENFKYNKIVIYFDSMENLFEDSSIYARFQEEYDEPQFYEEMYYHYSDINNEMDWVLIYAIEEQMMLETYPPETYYFIVGDIVYSTMYINKPFEVPYCVYDVEKDEFVGIDNDMIDDYEGLREVFCTPKFGDIIGDLDNDGVVSILDATEIQRIVAGISDLATFLVRDYNRDWNVDIMDATAIQRHIAGLE